MGNTNGSGKGETASNEPSGGSESDIAKGHLRRKTQLDIETQVQDQLKRTRLQRRQTSHESNLDGARSASQRVIAGLSTRFLHGISFRKHSSSALHVDKEAEIDENDYFFSDDRSQRVLKSTAKQVFLDALSKSKLLENTSSELRNELFEQAIIPVFVEPEDVLFEEGCFGHLLFVIVSGNFRCIQQHSRTRAFVRRRKNKGFEFGSGSIVADYCLFLNTPHEFTLKATSNGVVLALHRLQYHLTAARFLERGLGDDRPMSPGGESADASRLVSIPLLSSLTNDQLKRLHKCLKELKFKPNERILTHKQTLQGFYIVKSGQVALRPPRLTPDETLRPSASMGSMPRSREVSQLFKEVETDDIEWLSRGDFFGEASLFGDDAQLGVDVYSASEEGAKLWMLSTEDWKRVLKETSAPDDIAQTLRHVHVMLLMTRSPIFSSVDEEQLQTLASSIQFKTFEPGERIMEGGKPVTAEGGMYLITEGAVKLVPFQGLKVTPSQLAVQERMRFLQDSSRNLISSRRLNPSNSVSANTFFRDHVDTTGVSRGTSSRDLARGASVLGLSPSLMGRKMTELAVDGMDPRMSKVYSEASLGDAHHIKESNSNSSHSADHEALFLSLGMPGYRYVVLLPGELFGEEGISRDEQERNARASVYALGKATVAYLSVSQLEQLEMIVPIRRGVEEDERENWLSSISKWTDDDTKKNENVQRLKVALKITEKYLNFRDLKEKEKKLQEHEGKKEGRQRRNSKISFQLDKRRLIFLKNLHTTPVVDVTLDIHDPSHQAVVVKELNIAKANESGAAMSLLAEQTLLAQLSSPFVSKMIASWEEEKPEKLVLALEPALVGDLGELLNWTHSIPQGSARNPKEGEFGGFDLEFTRFVSACTVLALKHLYEHHILHRDIKPNNIVIDQFGYAKLIDFGCAKRLQPGTCHTSTLTGSPRYMSPELFATRPNYTNAIDWWSLGMTLMEAVTGKLPYADTKSKTIVSMEEAMKMISEYSREVLAGRATSKYSAYESHPWFKPFASCKNEIGQVFGKFLSKLLDPDPDLRLGSCTTPRGPRAALSDDVFKKRFYVMDEIAQRRAIPPFVPGVYLVDLEAEKIRLEQTPASKIITLAKRQEPLPKRPVLMRTNAVDHAKKTQEDARPKSSPRRADGVASSRTSGTPASPMANGNSASQVVAKNPSFQFRGPWENSSASNAQGGANSLNATGAAGSSRPLSSSSSHTPSSPVNSSSRASASINLVNDKRGTEPSSTAVPGTANTAAENGDLPTPVVIAPSASSSSKRHLPLDDEKHSVEMRVRAHLEHFETDNQKMIEALHSTGQAKKQAIMATNQHIRRVAFKHGLGLDELDSHDRLNLALLQRAAVMQTLQLIRAQAFGPLTKDKAAVRIQVAWRGYIQRKKLNAENIPTRSAQAFQEKFLRWMSERDVPPGVGFEALGRPEAASSVNGRASLNSPAVSNGRSSLGPASPVAGRSKRPSQVASSERRASSSKEPTF